MIDNLIPKHENKRLSDKTIDTTIYKNIEKFIPNDYKILDQADGDLNGDKIADKIVIIKLRKELASSECRPVLILIQQNGQFLLKVCNDSAVLSWDEGGVYGDPYHGITINFPYFSIEHFGGSGWRWNQSITFKYDISTDDWYLDKVKNEWWHLSKPDSIQYKIMTSKDFGIVKFIDYKNKMKN